VNNILLGQNSHFPVNVGINVPLVREPFILEARESSTLFSSVN
jgi:hypothetical protein